MNRRRSTLTALVAAAAVSLLFSVPAQATVRTTSATASTLPSVPTSGPCAYTPMPDQTYSTFVGLPPDPRRTPRHGSVGVDLRTNRGSIGLRLDRSEAPCTVQSFVFLTRQRYFDHTVCHRLTSYPTLSVLQCGDPLGTGEGDPGYSFKDELPTGLAPWPGDTTGLKKVYPRGTLAMANAGPNTNGSQFFLVYADSRLSADYTIFGRVSERGMRVLDRIAAGGVAAPVDDTTSTTDGPPALRTEIKRASIVRHHQRHHRGHQHC